MNANSQNETVCQQEKKQCSKCNKEKALNHFHKDRGSKDGAQSVCRSCRRDHYLKTAGKVKKYQARYRAEHREQIKAYFKKYYAEQKEELKVKVKKYQAENREQIKTRRAQYYMDNRAKIIARAAKYAAENKERIQKQGKKYRAKHAEELRFRNKQYYIKNSGDVKAKGKKYRAANRDRFPAYNRKWRAKLARGYVRNIIHRKYKIAYEDISEDMIERERELITMNRLFKEKANVSPKSTERRRAQ